MINFESIAAKMPSNKLEIVKEKFETTSKDKLDMLYTVNFKSSILAVFLGLFLGIVAADRFYKGDFGIAFIRLVLAFTVVGLVIALPWWIVDLFLVPQGIKEDNFKKFILVLN